MRKKKHLERRRNDVLKFKGFSGRISQNAILINDYNKPFTHNFYQNIAKFEAKKVKKNHKRHVLSYSYGRK